MALGFFRRRQKMVIIIMVVLMVSFLIGFQGFERLFERGRTGFEVGQTRYGALSNRDVQRADFELELLRRLPRQAPELMQVLTTDQPELTYALLLKEAGVSGLQTGQTEIEAFLDQSGLSGATLNSYVSQIRQQYKAGQDELNQAVSNWLAVRKLYLLSSSTPPPNDQAIRHLYRDLSEQVQVQYVRLRAEDFLDQTGEVTEETIQQQFRDNRDVSPRTLASADSFGFGYRQPDKARLSYLIIRPDLVERVVQPNEDAMRDYYRRHRSEFVQAPASQPATQTAQADAAATPTASAPAAPPRQLTYAEAKPEIASLLAGQAVQTKVLELSARLNSLAEQRGNASGDPLVWARAQLLTPAGEVLARPMGPVQMQAVALSDALTMLADKAGLAAIAFPVGRFGDTTVVPTIEVTIDVPQITLGEALAKLAEQARLPQLSWSTSPSMEGVLFATDSIDTFVVQYDQTELLDRRAMEEDELLGTARGSRGSTLADFAFDSSRRKDGREEGLKVGEMGPQMQTSQGGLMLWRLAEEVPSFVPESVDSVPGLREQIIADVKLQRAFELALAAGRTMEQAARQSGLTTTAGEGRQVEQTKLFSRKVVAYPQQQLASIIQMFGDRAPQQLVAQLFLAKEVDFITSRLDELNLPSPALRQRFIDSAFSLAPANPEAPPAAEPAVTVAAMPGAGQVLVLQRTDYKPPVEPQYEQTKTQLLSAVLSDQQWQNRQIWFTSHDVQQRTGFQEAKPEGAPATQPASADDQSA